MAYHDAAHVALTANRLILKHRSVKAAIAVINKRQGATLAPEKKRFWDAVIAKLRAKA